MVGISAPIAAPFELWTACLFLAGTNFPFFSRVSISEEFTVRTLDIAKFSLALLLCCAYSCVLHGIKGCSMTRGVRDDYVECVRFYLLVHTLAETR